MSKNNICPICAGSSFLYLDYKKIGKGDFQLRQCKSCRLIFTCPLPTGEFLHQFYQQYDSYGAQDNYYRQLDNYHQTREGKEVIDVFKSLTSQFNFSKELPSVDLGSGGGLFLDLLKRYGYQERGIEISEPAVKFAKDKFGVSCEVGDAETIDFASSSIGTVYMWDLLEHIRSQKDIFVRVNSWLVSGGYVIIETPDNSALINKLVLLLLRLGIKWPATWMFGYHHLFLHSQDSLSRLLEGSGFTIVKIIKKNTLASRIFPWNIKFFIPRLGLELLNALTYIIGGKNKFIIIAQKL